MNKVIMMIMVVVVCITQWSFAANKDFYSSGQIVEGETWDNVNVYNDGTIVDMTGGQIGNLNVYNYQNVFNLLGGDISGTLIDIVGPGIFNVSSGNIDTFQLVIESGGMHLPSAKANLSGGVINATHLKTYYDSTVNISGGTLTFNDIDIKGTLNIYGGQLNVNSYFNMAYDSVINIYGYGFNYIPGEWGTLTGYLMDDNPFVINGLSPSEYERLNLLPEPGASLLFMMGAVALCRKKSKKY